MKDRFLEYLSSKPEMEWGDSDIIEVRKVIREAELEVLRHKVQIKWGIDTCKDWIPENDAWKGRRVALLSGAWFDQHIPLSVIRRVLADKGIGWIWQIGECGWAPSYKIGLDCFVPWGMGATSVYWTSERMDWILHRTHEESVVLGGAWLIESLGRAGVPLASSKKS